MAIVNGYATLVDAKSRLDINGNTQDAKIEQMIEAASRQIDGLTARTFYAQTGTRKMTATHTDELFLDRDLHELTSIAIDSNRDGIAEDVWDATDWELEGDAPYLSVLVAPGSGRAFPHGRRIVHVTGKWGYGAAVPPAIREATLLLTARLFKRKDAPFGIAGSAEHGQIETLPGMDPDVKKLIEPYRRFGMVV